jgi:hypothetical protein
MSASGFCDGLSRHSEVLSIEKCDREEDIENTPLTRHPVTQRWEGTRASVRSILLCRHLTLEPVSAHTPRQQVQTGANCGGVYGYARRRRRASPQATPRHDSHSTETLKLRRVEARDMSVLGPLCPPFLKDY